MKSIKRIGIVSNSAFNIYNYRLGLMKAFQQHGWEVIAIAPEDSFSVKIKEANIPFIPVNGLARKGTNPYTDLLLVNELRKIYTENNLDLVLQYTIKPNIYGTLAARICDIPSICTVTGLGYVFLNSNLSNRIAKMLYRLAFSLANKVIFQNPDDIKVFTEQKLVSNDKAIVFPGSGINTDDYSPSFCSEKQDKNYVFLMISRLLEDKGILEFVEAAKNIRKDFPEVIFRVVGELDHDNPSAISQKTLDEWIKKGWIEYAGFAEDVRPFICGADAVVLPSYREGLPRVILEGMSMSKPCITTDTPGCRETIIDGDSGLLAKVRDAESLEVMMRKLYAMKKEDQIQMGKKARERVLAVFDEKMIINKYIALIENITL